MAKSRGLGDDLKKVFDATGITNLVEKTVEVLGIEDCGCSRRQEWANNLVPYDNPQPQSEENFVEGKYRVINNFILNHDKKAYPYEKDNIIYITSDNPLFQSYKMFYKLGVLIYEP